MTNVFRRKQSRAAGGAILGPLEFEVMAAIWKRGPSMVSEIASALPQKPAHTTILSTCTRLVAKGLLAKGDKCGKADVYAPIYTEREWQASAAREALERFLATPNVPRRVLLEAFRRALGEHVPADT